MADKPIPYEPIKPSSSYRHLDGSWAPSDGTFQLFETSHTADYIEEVKLVQLCLGVAPDGIIGPKTRAAARAVYDRATKPSMSDKWLLSNEGDVYRLSEKAADGGGAYQKVEQADWRDVPVTAGMLIEALEPTHYSVDAIERLAREKLI